MREEVGRVDCEKKKKNSPIGLPYDFLVWLQETPKTSTKTSDRSFYPLLSSRHTRPRARCVGFRAVRPDGNDTHVRTLLEAGDESSVEHPGPASRLGRRVRQIRRLAYCRPPSPSPGDSIDARTLVTLS